MRIEQRLRALAASLKEDCKLLEKAMRCMDRIEQKVDDINEKIIFIDERLEKLETAAVWIKDTQCSKESGESPDPQSVVTT